MRWYVTEKLDTQPIHQGRMAYYDLQKTQLIERIELIKMLQNEYGYSIDNIRTYLNKYEGKDFSKLLALLEPLYLKYPLYVFSRLSSKKVLNLTHAVIHNKILTSFEKGELDLDNFSLSAMANTIMRWDAEQFDEYRQMDDNFIERFGYY